jgi:flavin reductase
MVTREGFRESMAHLGAAVSVVTTSGPAGRCGFTASAVCSLTDDPPTLAVCMNRGSAQNPVFRENGVICVNTLAARQADLTSVFSGQKGLDMEARFAMAGWSELETGAPVLEGALVSFDCRIDRTFEVGTHSLFVCRVVALALNGHEHGLMYFKRACHVVGAPG